MKNLIESQIIQEEPDFFIIKVVTTPAFTEKDENLIVQNMRKHIGYANIQIQKTDAIPRLLNGKFKAVISKVKR